jgi:high-affinity nickel-transport protein
MHFESFKAVGGIVGTLMSAGLLLAIGIANVFVLVGVYRAFKRAKSGGHYAEDDLDLLPLNHGFLVRLFRPLFCFVHASWQMYPLGFLFGLGFDTATEIGVLGISAAQAAQGLPVLCLLIFPALFTPGMALVDTADSLLMLSAYGWAFVKPIRKLYYNLTITAASVLVALLIGSIEALGLIGQEFALHGELWDFAWTLNGEFGVLGYLIIALFAFAWALSIAIYRFKGSHRLSLFTART